MQGLSVSFAAPATGERGRERRVETLAIDPTALLQLATAKIEPLSKRQQHQRVDLGKLGLASAAAHQLRCL